MRKYYLAPSNPSEWAWNVCKSTFKSYIDACSQICHDCHAKKQASNDMRNSFVLQISCNSNPTQFLLYELNCNYLLFVSVALFCVPNSYEIILERGIIICNFLRFFFAFHAARSSSRELLNKKKLVFLLFHLQFLHIKAS